MIGFGIYALNQWFAAIVAGLSGGVVAILLLFLGVWWILRPKRPSVIKTAEKIVVEEPGDWVGLLYDRVKQLMDSTGCTEEQANKIVYQELGIDPDDV